MSRNKNKLVMKVKTEDGGVMTFIPNERGYGGRIEKTMKGYRETPEARLDRIQGGFKANRFEVKKDRSNRGGRKGSKNSAIARSMREW